MATEHDVARALTGTHEALSLRHDNKIVNPNPGYLASHGTNVDEQGRTIYRNPTWAGPGILLVRARTSSNQTITTGSTDIINYATEDYDPGADFTSGASHLYTAPATGWYQISVTGFVNPLSNVWTAGDFFDLLVWHNGSLDGSTSGVVASWITMATTVATNYNVFFQGVITYPLTAADTFQLRFENQSAGVSRRLSSGATLAISKVA